MKANNWKLLRFLPLLALSLVIVFAGCTKDDDDGDNEEVVYIDEIRNGWEAYELMDYNTALEHFEAALEVDPNGIEGFSGAGWCNYSLGDNTEAASMWNDGLNQQGNKIDIYAGLAHLAFSNNDYEEVIHLYEDEVLAVNSSYRFIHDSNLDTDAVLLILAESYYLTADYASALEKIQILDPLFVVDLDTSEGREELAAKIEELKSGGRG